MFSLSYIFRTGASYYYYSFWIVATAFIFYTWIFWPRVRESRIISKNDLSSADRNRSSMYWMLPTKSTFFNMRLRKGMPMLLS